MSCQPRSFQVIRSLEDPWIGDKKFSCWDLGGLARERLKQLVPCQRATRVKVSLGRMEHSRVEKSKAVVFFEGSCSVDRLSLFVHLFFP